MPLQRPDGSRTYLLEALGGTERLLHLAGDGAAPPGGALAIGRDLIDADGLFAERFDATPGACWLVRPDQHLAARWRRFDAAAVAAAARRLRGLF